MIWTDATNKNCPRHAGLAHLQRSIIAIAVVVVTGVAARLDTAAAQSPAPRAAPGAGRGFLIDKHVAAGIDCAACHQESTAKAPATTTCLTCHGGTYAKLAATTEDDEPNPHASHQGEVACLQCHHVHTASTTLCNQCHTFDMKTP